MIALQIRSLDDKEWLDAYLEDDVSIEIELNSPIWNSNAGSFSQQIELSIEQNLHIVGNIGSVRGDNVYKILYGRRCRLFVEGILFFSGVVHLDDRLPIKDGKVEIELASANLEFEDLIDGVNAQDVQPVGDDGNPIQIGYCGGKGSDVTAKANLYATNHKSWGYGGYPAEAYVTYPIGASAVEFHPTIILPVLMSPRYYVNGELQDYTNISLKYPDAKYCNIRICSQKYSQDDKKDGTAAKTWSKTRAYNVMEYWRLNTSPCFFVLAWMDWLFEQMGIAVTSNTLSSIPDLNALAFVHSDCRFDVEPDAVPNAVYNNTYIGKDVEGKDVEIPISVSLNIGETPGKICYFSTKKADFSSTSYISRNKRRLQTYNNVKITENGQEINHGNADLLVNIFDVKYKSNNYTLHKAYANGKNFPDVDAQDVIEGISNAFGARFIFDSNTKSMKIVLVRDILRQDECIDIPCTIVDVYHEFNHKKGFVLKYESSKAAERNGLTKEELLTGTKDKGEDTTYNYNDYTKFNKVDDYLDIVKNVSAYDKNLYYVPGTGNAFRIKVDGDATVYQELYPSLFEVGGYGDAQYGDCSEEKFVETVSIPFTPAIPNDVNIDNEKEKGSDDDKDDIQQKFAMFCDVEIHEGEVIEVKTNKPIIESPEDFVKMFKLKEGINIQFTSNTGKSQFYEHTYKINIPVGYSDSDEDNIATNEQDFGFCLGVMRTTKGSDNRYITEEEYDDEGNLKWDYGAMSNGEFTSDSFDQYGRKLCEHGADEECLSLKLKAEKKNPYWKEGEGNYKYKDYTNDKTGYFEIENAAARRGLFDKFYTEYAYWVVNRKVAVITAIVEIADIINIDFTKKYRIGDFVGFLKSVKTSVDNSGVSTVKFELYYL